MMYRAYSLLAVIYLSSRYVRSSSTSGVRFTLYGQAHTWNEVYAICRDQGGKMLTFHTEQDLDIFEKFTDKWTTDGHLTEHIWIGLHDNEPDTSSTFVFRWDDCSEGFVKWASNEPNNKGSDNCVRHVPHTGYRTRDCSDLYATVCQTNLGECWFTEKTDTHVSSLIENSIIEVNLDTCKQTCLDMNTGSDVCIAVEFMAPTCKIFTGSDVYVLKTPDLISKENTNVYIKRCYKGVYEPTTPTVQSKTEKKAIVPICAKESELSTEPVQTSEVGSNNGTNGTSSGDSDASASNGTSSGGSDTSASNGTSSGGSDASASNGTSSGGSDTSASNGTSSGGSDTSASNGTSSGGSDASASNGTSSGGSGASASNGTALEGSDASAANETSSNGSDVSASQGISSGGSFFNISKGTSSGGSDASASNGTSSGGSDTSASNGTSSGGSDTSASNGTSSGGSDASASKGTSSGGSDASTSNGRSSGGSDTSASNGTSSGGSDASASNGTSSGGSDTIASNGTSSGGSDASASNGTSSGGSGASASNGTALDGSDASAANETSSNGSDVSASNGISSGGSFFNVSKGTSSDGSTSKASNGTSSGGLEDRASNGTSSDGSGGNVSNETSSVRSDASVSNGTSSDGSDASTSKNTSSGGLDAGAKNETSEYSSHGIGNDVNETAPNESNITSTLTPDFGQNIHFPEYMTGRRCFCLDRDEESITALNALIESLLLDKKKLSSYKRTKISARDDRPSSISIGNAGVCIFVLIFVGLIFLDCSNVIESLLHGRHRRPF